MSGLGFPLLNVVVFLEITFRNTGMNPATLIPIYIHIIYIYVYIWPACGEFINILHFAEVVISQKLSIICYVFSGIIPVNAWLLHADAWTGCCVWGTLTSWMAPEVVIRPHTVYPKKYAHGYVVLCFVVVMQSFIMNSHEVFIHIHQGCFAVTGAIVRLPQCQWSKPDGYGKISQCITTTKHSKAKTVCIFLGIYCILQFSKVKNHYASY